jgi:endoglucanase
VSGTVDSIQVYRDTDSNPSGRSRLAIPSASERSYTDTTAVAGTQYWYWIKFRADGKFYNAGAATAMREAGCDATAITPYIQVDGTWSQVSSVTIPSGTQITFGPQPVTGGSWSWSGCGTSEDAREQTVSPTASCTATAVYTNSCGATSSQDFAVTVDGGSSSIYPNYNINPLPADMTGMSSNALDIANNITLGFNIGNTMEATGGETAWGNPMITADFVSLVKQSGFNAIRLPLAWDQYADQTTAEIDLSWLARVREVVQYCVDNDLYVIVNIHWDGGWLENNITLERQAENNDKQRAYWQQIATYLRDFDEHLLFASANEPNVADAEEMSVLLSYHQTFVDAVRETGGKNANRVLIVQGPDTDISKTNDLMTEMPVDTVSDRMMAEIHFYTPWNFAGMTADESWGNQFYYWGAGNHSTTDTAHNPTWGEEEDLNTLFSLMKTQFVDQGIPVVMGEFGAIRRTEQLSGDDLTLHLKSRADYHRFVAQQAKAYGMVPFYWDNGGTGNHGFGIFDRNTNTVFDQQVLDALMQGAAN